MISTPSSFTYERLSNLKFKELQKLSSQYHVSKRWAKKQELIEKLVALKEEKTNENHENNEWKDGSTVFNDLDQNSEKEIDRRLTFNVNSKNDPRLTFEVCQNKMFEGKLHETINASSPEQLVESRATFNVPLKDPRATFNIPQNSTNLLEDHNISLLNNSSEDQGPKDLVELKAKEVKNEEKAKKLDTKLKKIEQSKSSVKSLTIPDARVTRRTKTDGEIARKGKSPMKISQKSIIIKKSTRASDNKLKGMKSPALSSVKKQTIIENLRKTETGKITQSKVPVRLRCNEEKSEKSEKEDVENKENVKKTTRRKISKTADEILVKKRNTTRVNFSTPPALKSSRVLLMKKTSVRKDGDGRAETGTNSVTKSTTKLITATKMPDFNKIHKRQFEQMDSLHDYVKKKEDRMRKLFGTPQPGQQLLVQSSLNKTAPVFHFQSETKNKISERLKALATPRKRELESKEDQKKTFKSRLPPPKLQTDIKDKNRSHIHGVRTNKRFELQMKFRNL